MLKWVLLSVSGEPLAWVKNVRFSFQVEMLRYRKLAYPARYRARGYADFSFRYAPVSLRFASLRSGLCTSFYALCTTLGVMLTSSFGMHQFQYCFYHFNWLMHQFLRSLHHAPTTKKQNPL